MTKLCPKCNQLFVGRGDGCLVDECPRGETFWRSLSEVPQGQDWLHEEWTDGKKTIHTMVPLLKNAKGYVMYDCAVSLRIARSMFAPNKKHSDVREELEKK